VGGGVQLVADGRVDRLRPAGLEIRTGRTRPCPPGWNRTTAPATAYLLRPAWSADGRFVALRSAEGIGVADLRGYSVKYLGKYTGFDGWAPTGHTLAASSREGLSLVNVDTGRGRLLTSDRPLLDRARWVA